MQHDASWIRHFTDLAGLPEAQRLELAQHARVVSLKEGARVYEPGQAAENYLLLLEGSVRVQQVSETGREMVLYRVASGESCVLTVACLMGASTYPAEAIAETAVRAVIVPRVQFEALIAHSAEFRHFVFAAFGARLAELLHVLGDVIFTKVEARLAGKLIELSRGGDIVTATQQQLAAELGTAREVVSRSLGEFHRRGVVTPHRGHISITDREALARLAREK